MTMISGLSGNEIYCLRQKGYTAGDIVVGNSVCSLGVLGTLSTIGRSITGGEVKELTDLIGDGRRRAIARMEAEARQDGAIGIAGVSSSISSLGGHAEFFAQGTGIHREGQKGSPFSTAASGSELFCHLDIGYEPRRFVMGNVAHALGLTRGITSTVRTLAHGEVKEFSAMYDELRRTCLVRLREEAFAAGANAVIDVFPRMLPFGAATVELLMSGTASTHSSLDAKSADEVVTSELTGDELWNLAALGEVPVQIVMATSVQSIGVVGSVSSMVQAMGKGELPELTKLIYEAREQCLDRVRADASALGATRVVGNKLHMRELGSGLVEIVAIGTAVRSGDSSCAPRSPSLIPQAIATTKCPSSREDAVRGVPGTASMSESRGEQQTGAQLAAFAIVLFTVLLMCLLLGGALILQRVG